MLEFRDMKLRNLSLSIGVVLALALAPVSTAWSGQKKAKEKIAPMPITVSKLTRRPSENKRTVEQGKRIYQNACIFCHGPKADGKGSVTFFLSRDIGPHPRDLTSETYKLRTTLSGELPLDEDLYRVITKGIPGFMPGFEGLSTNDRWKLVYFIKSLNSEFKGAERERLLVVGAPVPATATSIRNGYRVYQKYKCWECHGGGGEGDGKKAPGLTDIFDHRLPPQDLTRPSAFKNGQRPVDVYRSIMTGMDGADMPSYVDFFIGKERWVWDLVNYIESLSRE